MLLKSYFHSPQNLERHIDNMHKNHKHEMGLKKARQRASNEEVEDLRKEVQRLYSLMQVLVRGLDSCFFFFFFFFFFLFLFSFLNLLLLLLFQLIDLDLIKRNYLSDVIPALASTPIYHSSTQEKEKESAVFNIYSLQHRKRPPHRLSSSIRSTPALQHLPRTDSAYKRLSKKSSFDDFHSKVGCLPRCLQTRDYPS